MRMDSR